jgi:uncharacterized protein (DUF2141 family)
MKKTILIALITISNFIYCQNVSLTVDVSGFKNNKGKIMIGVYNSEANFLKKTFLGKIASIKDKKAQAVFENVSPGIYAVSVYHDENENNKLDTNFLGIPKESYASSNDAKGFMGPPKYNDAKFDLKSDKIINIKL